MQSSTNLGKEPDPVVTSTAQCLYLRLRKYLGREGNKSVKSKRLDVVAHTFNHST